MAENPDEVADPRRVVVGRADEVAIALGLPTTLRAVVFDLDGVLRHFDDEDAVGIERRHGLQRCVLAQTAFASPLIEAVTTGRMTRQEWIAAIGDVVGIEAASEWGSIQARVDVEMLALADELRDAGLIVAILTNGTDTIAHELAASGIDRHVDAVFNSAEIGFAKPDERVFRQVLTALELRGPEVFFTDDSTAKLTGATTVGMRTHHFTDAASLRRALAEVG